MKIGILTGGGDCPGLNAVVRGVTKSALRRGWEVIGFRDGYRGLVEKDFMQLHDHDVSGIIIRGGTMLGTSNTANPFAYTLEPLGSCASPKDLSKLVFRNFRELELDALVAIGGDGTLTMAEQLYKRGMPVVGVPKTIDNDLSATDVTFGFDSALHVATQAVDRVHTTAESHDRVMIVETMGRYAGWIALNAGVSGNADAILIPEIPYDIDKVAAALRERPKRGKHYAIVVVAEGAKPKGGAVSVLSKELGRAEKLGGAGERVAKDLEPLVGKECRTVVLGHLLRGGCPTTFDRLISLRFGAAAVRALEEGRTGVMVALDPPTVRYVPLKEATSHMKIVPLDCDTVLTARDLGISFGD